MRHILIFLTFTMLSGASAVAQQMDHSHMQGMNHGAMMGMPGIPTEPGQSAFAAIQEIVGILERDAATDWTKVNIDALRHHLIDMDNVTLRATTTAHEENGSLRFSATGEGAVRQSIRRMLTAHAAAMNGAGGMQFTARETADGADLTVTATDPGQLVKFRALGLVGVLAFGMHHQMHHIMIARGQAPHG